MDLHVDRRLPANRASDELKLLYSKRSKKDLDWWCPLLEKAYAKENFQLDFPGKVQYSTEYFMNFRSLPLTVQFGLTDESASYFAILFTLESSTVGITYLKIAECESLRRFYFPKKSA